MKSPIMRRRQSSGARKVTDPLEKAIGDIALRVGVLSIAICSAASILLVACSPKAEPVNLQRRTATLTVHLELNDQRITVGRCVALHTWGDTVPVGPGPYGCTTFDPATSTATIYATEPQQVDDAFTLLLGHEMLHAYGGAYHPGFEP